tara:strand:+ start:3900 stop:4067 length:168 start_codon:yes stop_codon:yes gene_type:complete
MGAVDDGIRTTFSIFDLMSGTAGAVVGYFALQALFMQGANFLSTRLGSATNGNRR